MFYHKIWLLERPNRSPFSGPSESKAREGFKVELSSDLDRDEIDSQVLECEDRYSRHRK